MMGGREDKRAAVIVLKASLRPLHSETPGQEEKREAIGLWLGVLDSNDAYRKSDRERMI